MTKTQGDLIVGALWLVCIIVCFLKWKTWTAIFGIIGLIIGNLPTTGTHLHYLVMGPATSLALAVVAIRLAKPRLLVGEMVLLGTTWPEPRTATPKPETRKGVGSIPGATDGF
jgi:hypothetical protein